MMREHLLPDALLRRLAERCAGYDRENRFFRRGFRRSAAGRLPDDAGAEGARRRRPHARRAMPRAASARLLRAGDGARRQHAPLLGRAGRPICGARATARWNGCSGRRWRARCSAPAIPSAATTCRVLLSTSKAERVDGGFRFTGRKMFATPDAGVDALWSARDLGRRRGGAEDRACLPAARA